MTINERIKILINFYCGGNNSAFARKIGISAPLVGTYLPAEEGSSTSKRVSVPGYEQLFKILEAFPDVSAEWLIRGEGSMYLTTYQAQIVSGKSHKQYIEGITKNGYVDNLPYMLLPLKEMSGKDIRVFEVLNMDYIRPLHSNSFVIAQTSSFMNSFLVKGHPYVFVTKSTIYVGRFLEREDNKIYSQVGTPDTGGEQTRSVDVDELLELWEVRSAIISKFPLNVKISNVETASTEELINMKEWYEKRYPKMTKNDIIQTLIERVREIDNHIVMQEMSVTYLKRERSNMLLLMDVMGIARE